jgi:hypothetical protein
MSQFTQESLALIAECRKNSMTEDFKKAAGYTVGLGLTAYDLQPVAKKFFPVITPLRNMFPRIPGAGDTATRWKSITGINVNGMTAGTGEGHRGGVVQTNVINRTASYAFLSLEDFVTWQAEWAAQGFEDVKNDAVQNLLYALMMQEEGVLLGGNNDVPLGIGPTPTLATATTGGSIPASTAVYVRVVPLTLDGYGRTSIAGGCPGRYIKALADGKTETDHNGGNGQISAAANITTGAGGTNVVTAYWTPVPGAVAYALYWGASAAGATIGAITTLNSYAITTAAGAGTQTASDPAVSADYSSDPYVFDGLLSIAGRTANGGTWESLATGTVGQGTTLTSDGKGGVTQCNTAFQYLWDNYRFGPEYLLVSGRELLTINQLVIQGGGAPLFRFNFDANAGSATAFEAGRVVGSLINPFVAGGGGQFCKLVLHPNMPAGTMVYLRQSKPYPVSNVANLWAVKAQKEYYQVEYPLVSPQWQYAVMCEEVLQDYFPKAVYVQSNIGH